MFDKLGQFVSRFWGPVLIGWVLLLVVLFRITPPFDSMLKQGEFAFLPDDSDSVQAEALFVKAFPDDLLTSTVVIVARRPARQSGLTEDDRDYIHDTLVPLLRSIGVRSTASEDEPDEAADLKAEKYAKQFQHLKLTEEESNLVYRVRDWTHPRIGHLLNSKHGKATLLIISLTTEYIADDNIPLIWKIDQLRETLKLNVDEELRIPAGMELSLSGTATVGRDMRTASKESGQRTESATIILVLVLLILIYRAPLLAIIPLVTVGVAVATSMLVLSNLASFGVVSLFKDIEVFIKVLAYGAGVDYCLFLIARYKEELDQGATYPQATSASIGKVGAALAASAGTSAIGIGMMSFAEFGKFQQAGNAIFIALMICLLTSLTFAPALIRLCGKWAFWPYLPNESVQRVSWFSPTNLLGRLMKGDVIDRFWVNMCQRIEKAPAKIWVITVSLMLPFAFFGTVFIDQLSYGLLSELPDHYLSVQGARAAQQHFPPGETGPAQVLLSNPSIDFTQSNVINQLELLTEKIKAHREELDVSDIRSVNDPTGITDRAIKHQEELEKDLGLIERRVTNQKIREYYVTQVDELNHSITRLDLVFTSDPFSRDSIANFNLFRERMEQYAAEFDIAIQELHDEEILALKEELEEPGLENDEISELQEALKDVQSHTILPTELSFLGPTASIADLKAVTDRDQIRIEVLVLTAVFLILVMLLRRVMISFYLLMSVFFTFFVSLGAAALLFYSLDPSGFAGLDWKVPVFLFTILIAVGEDYNILLMTRIGEEQKEHGLVEGTLQALQKTGSIISSCGVIMAGTFSSLLFGTLLGMQQLGFALAFGVLIDTFIVRPILVPAWLVMLYRGYFGPLGRFLGAPRSEPNEPEPTSSKT